jgi:hypothetical protein
MSKAAALTNGLVQNPLIVMDQMKPVPSAATADN